ncbi:ArsR family transcriptional regulator [Alicyclobacillaceae bacterium I2511]|nr:ArsR family transcriptional regulator [Alicyclobacillaceae bacterium I2511]
MSMAELQQSTESGFFVSIKLENLLKVLADPVRLQILRILSNDSSLCCRLVPMVPKIEFRSEPQYGLCVQDLVAHLDIPQSTVSHHLAVLRNSGLVCSVKQGVCVYYYRDEQVLKALKDAIISL